MGGLSIWHILIVVVVFVLLFGARRLPDTARSLGRSARIFRSETRGMLAASDSSGDVGGAARLREEADRLRARAAELDEAAGRPHGSGT